jgi:hypothetical protein
MSRAGRAIAAAIAFGVAAVLPHGVHAQDPTCKQVFNGIKLQANTPNHQFFTISGAEPDSHAQTNEIITTGRARYVLMNGLWQTLSESPREIMKREEENFKKSKTICRWLREEAIDGAAASVYVEQSQTGPISSLGTIWIAKASGLPVREEVNTDAGTGPGGKRHLEIRIVYTDVHAPVTEK